MYIRNRVQFIARVGSWQEAKQFTPLQVNEFGEVTTGIGSIFVGRHEIEGEVGQYAVVDGAISFGMRQSSTLKKSGGDFGWHETVRVRVSDAAYFDTLEDASDALRALTAGAVEDAVSN